MTRQQEENLRQRLKAEEDRAIRNARHLDELATQCSSYATQERNRAHLLDAAQKELWLNADKIEFDEAI